MEERQISFLNTVLMVYLSTQCGWKWECAVSLNCKTQVGFHVLLKHVDHRSIFLFIFTACLVFRRQ